MTEEKLTEENLTEGNLTEGNSIKALRMPGDNDTLRMKGNIKKYIFNTTMFVNYVSSLFTYRIGEYRVYIKLYNK